MKKLLRIFVWIACIDLVVTDAHSMTTNELLEFCSSRDAGKYGVCVGYTIGIVDSQEFQRKICPPSRLTNGQKLDDIIAKVTKQKSPPPNLALEGISAAALELYPCH